MGLIQWPRSSVGTPFPGRAGLQGRQGAVSARVRSRAIQWLAGLGEERLG